MNKTVLEPRLQDLLQSLRSEIFKALNVAKPGVITSFDPATKVAMVQILDKRILPNGSTPSYPEIECPVFTLQGGGGAIQFPIQAGDQCLILFADRNLDNWFGNGLQNPPRDARCHDLSDGICLVGLNPLTSAMDDYQADTARWFYGGMEIAFNDGKVTIQNDAESLTAVLTDLLTILSTMSSASITAGTTQAALGALIPRLLLVMY